MKMRMSSPLTTYCREKNVSDGFYEQFVMGTNVVALAKEGAYLPEYDPVILFVCFLPETVRL